MNTRLELPDYFLADLADASALSATLVREACQAIRRNRARYLAGRSTAQLIQSLSGVASDWLDPEFPFRKQALETGSAATGFSRATIERGLDNFFRQITPDTLRALVVQDLGSLKRLDEPGSDQLDGTAKRQSLARGPELMVHITGGVLPSPALLSIALGFVVRSAQFVKCARGASFIPRLFAHSIYAADSKLGSCLELAEWKGGTEPLEQALFAEADFVTATGADQTLEALRQRLPARVRFIGYGHKVSFGYVSREALDLSKAGQWAARAAQDVAAWDQSGCLSPHLIYVETGGQVGPEQFAELLAAQLEALEQSAPRGQLEPAEAAAISSRRSFYQVRAAASSFGTRVWASQKSTSWTVVFEDDPRCQLSCLNRFVYVKAVAGLEQALQGADAWQGQVSTVGLAAARDQFQDLSPRLARWGAARVCPLGHMQSPPLTWRHDGRPALGDLVTWTDFETE